MTCPKSRGLGLEWGGGLCPCDVTSRGRGSLSREVPSPQGGEAGVALSSEVPCLDCGSLVTTGPIDENQS